MAFLIFFVINDSVKFSERFTISCRCMKDFKFCVLLGDDVLVNVGCELRMASFFVIIVIGLKLGIDSSRSIFGS